MSSDTEGVIRWSDVWLAVRGSDRKARARAFRETLIVVIASLAPFVLGALLTVIREQRSHTPEHQFWTLLYSILFQGQLFLLFISLAGTIFARLWDVDGPKYQFTAFMSLFHIVGGAIAAGLLAIDPTSGGFEFLPTGALSLFFFSAVVINYFFMSVPEYLHKPDLQESANLRSEQLSKDLEARMK